MPFNVLPFSVMPQFRAMPVCEMTIYRIGLLPFSMFNLEEKLSIEFCHGYTSIWNLASALSKSDQLFLIRCLPQKENAKYPHSTRTLSESTHINKNSVFFTKRSASLKCTPWPRLSPKPREMKWRSERRVLYWLLSNGKIWERIWRQVSFFCDIFGQATFLVRCNRPQW